MLYSKDINVFDGSDLVIQTYNVNVYNDELIINNFLGFNLTFKFERSDPKPDQDDIQVSGEGKNGLIVVSNKIRRTLGAGSFEKLELVNSAENNLKLLFSLYVSKIGDQTDALNVNLTFYQRKTN